MRRFWNKLSVRLLLVALAPALLVSAALSVPMIELRRQQLLEQAGERVVQAGRTSEAVFAERLSFAQQLAELLAERAAVVQADDPTALAAFVRETREYTLFDLVTLVDARGNVLAQDGAGGLWRGLEPTPLTVWGDPEVGVVIEIHVPIPFGSGPARTFAGSFALNAHSLGQLRERTGMEHSLLLNGQLVATSLPARSTNTLNITTGADTLASDTDPQTREVLLGETSYLARTLPLRDDAGQVVAVAELLLPLEAVRIAQRQASTLLLLITLLAVLAAAMFALILARWVGRPVRILERASAGLGRGELNRPVAVEGPAELVALGGVLETTRTQLAAALTALGDEKQRYAGILESIEEALLTVDSRGTVTGMNGSAERLLGVSRSTAVASSLDALLPLADGGRLERERVPLGATLRVALRGQDGQPRTVAIMRQLLLGQPGASREEVLVLRDISDDVAISQLKEAFLANISHEFQTPLAALLASVELLRDEDESLSADERRGLTDSIAVGARRLQQLVVNLLDSASLQAGYFRVEPELSNLRPLLEEAVATVEPVARQRGQTIAMELPAHLPPLLADEPRLIQALVNLLSNASKFGPPGDTLQLRVTLVDEQIRIAVTDHGPGVPLARRTHLFERFLRPGTETVRAQGAGLGLAITRAIVERHGGTLALDGETAGTTFVISLPRAALAEEDRDEAAVG